MVDCSLPSAGSATCAQAHSALACATSTAASLPHLHLEVREQGCQQASLQLPAVCLRLHRMLGTWTPGSCLQPGKSACSLHMDGREHRSAREEKREDRTYPAFDCCLLLAACRCGPGHSMAVGRRLACKPEGVEGLARLDLSTAGLLHCYGLSLSLGRLAAQLCGTRSCCWSSLAQVGAAQEPALHWQVLAQALQCVGWPCSTSAVLSGLQLARRGLQIASPVEASRAAWAGRLSPVIGPAMA